MSRRTFFDSNKAADVTVVIALINNLSATTNPGVGNDNTQGYEVGSVWINTSSGAIYQCTSAATGAAVWQLLGADNVANPAAGVAAGYKIARGVHLIAAASDTVVTGLATVVAVVACFQDAPTININQIAASIGNQSGAPAAGSILINSYAPTANNNVTPVAATVFTDNIHVNWIAIGT